jgi:hypothetical protein
VKGVLRRLFLEPEPPQVAVEVRPRSVGVVRVAREGQRQSLAAAAFLELAPEALRPSISGDNVADAAGFRAALRGACERAGVLAGARAALVLPDPVGRVTVLPGSELPARGAVEIDQMVRFRLRKSLPFDVRDARLALRRDGDAVLAVAASRLALDPYEAACRECGLEPGQVELAGIALLDAVLASRPGGDRLVVNWDHGYVSLLLARGGSPALVRTLVGPAADSAEAVRREIEGTLVYYNERLGGGGLAGVSLRPAPHAGAGTVSELQASLGVPVEAIEAWGGEPRLPLQPVAAAAASLFRRVA